jgi:hypothetical protein
VFMAYNGRPSRHPVPFEVVDELTGCIQVALAGFRRPARGLKGPFPRGHEGSQSARSVVKPGFLRCSRPRHALKII